MNMCHGQQTFTLLPIVDAFRELLLFYKAFQSKTPCKSRRMKLLLALFGVVHLAFAGRSVPREFVIDLEKAPGERWKDVAQTFGAHIRAHYMMFERMTGVLSGDKLEKIHAMGQRFPKPYYDEVVGFAKYANISVTQGILLQIIYDMTVTCTSIICVDDENVIWHLRNLDYTPTAPLKSITINVEFRKKTRSIYKGTTFAGMVGLLTGVRRRGFSVSLNQRILNESFKKNLMTTMVQMKRTGHAWPVSILMRDLLGREDVNYKKAFNVLSTFPLIAPCYFIIGGQKKDEGAVIIRNRKGVDSERLLDPAKGRWFVLMPNSDLKYKNLRYLRSYASMQIMTQKRVTLENMWFVLTVARQTTTVFSTIMSAKSYTLNSTIPHL